MTRHLLARCKTLCSSIDCSFRRNTKRSGKKRLVPVVLVLLILQSCGATQPTRASSDTSSTAHPLATGTKKNTPVVTSTRQNSSETRQALVVPPSLMSGSPGVARLAAYSSNGVLLSWSLFRQTESNNTGSNGLNDVLLNSANLTVLSMSPLYQPPNGATTAQLMIKKTSSTLGLAWPSDQGYSNLLCDIPGAGTYNFDQLCVASLLRDIYEIWSVNVGFTPSSSVVARYSSLVSLFSSLAVPVFNQTQLTIAMDLDLEILQEVASYRSVKGGSTSSFDWGVTLDTLSNFNAAIDTIHGMFPTHAWIRLVLDPGVSAKSYANAVRYAHEKHVSVLGELVDSSYMSGLTYPDFKQRVVNLVASLHSVDAWEVGNEVNGNWLGKSVGAKVAFAVSYVASHSKAPLMLTLYWQLGEDDATHSIFEWVSKNLTKSEISKIQFIGISLYPQEAPMGTAFNRAVEVLHKVWFPDQKIFISELGYGGQGVSGSWTWGAISTPIQQVQVAVAVLYIKLLYGYTFSGGGPFWWYFSEDVKTNHLLIFSLKSTYRYAKSGNL